MIRLMITSDDCGMAEGINYVTADYHMLGRINVASVTTNFGATTQHAFDVFEQHPALELGVHLNLSDGVPLTPEMQEFDLMRGSARRILDKLYWVSRTLMADAAAMAIVKAEMRAQIEAFLETGRHPAHLTTHGHFHMLPALREMIYQLAEEYNIAWVRSSDVRQSIIPLNPMTYFDVYDSAIPDKVIVPDYLLPIYSWVLFSPQQMLDDLLKADGLVEIVVHASPPDDLTFPDNTGYKPGERARETRYLSTFFELLKPHLGVDITLVNTISDLQSNN